MVENDKNKHCFKASDSGFSYDNQVDDINLWAEGMPKELIDYWAVKGPEDIHHSDVKSLDAKPVKSV